SGPFLAGPLCRAITSIAERHQVLRMQFGNVDGRPVVSVSPAADVPCVMDEAEGESVEARLLDARRRAAEEADPPFDLGSDLLFRARVIRIDAADHVLVVVVHHLVADGWSIGVLASEIATLYNAFSCDEPSPLPQPAIQYADFATWQREHLSGDRLKEQVSW